MVDNDYDVMGGTPAPDPATPQPDGPVPVGRPAEPEPAPDPTQVMPTAAPPVAEPPKPAYDATAFTYAERFKVVRQLGAGSCTESYLGEDPQGAKAVIKIAHTTDDASRERVRSVVETISSIQNPNLPRIYEWGDLATDFYLVREYVSGADLASQVETKGKLAPVHVARYGSEAASALSAIAARGAVHGNVKTSNLILTGADNVVLVGYGLGLADPGRNMAEVSPPQHAAYLSPEQAKGNEATAKSDVYALGVVLYELTTGAKPFNGDTARQVADAQIGMNPRRPSEIVPGTPAALDTLIMQMLAKDAAVRPDATQVQRELEGLTGQLSGASGATAGGGEAKKAGFPWWGWLLIVLAVLAIIGGGVFLWMQMQATGPTIPDLKGKTVEQANAALAPVGMRVGNVSYTGSSVPGVSDGNIATQTPSPGGKPTQGGAVDVVLAGQNQSSVPSLKGQTQSTAQQTLQQAGFVLGEVTSKQTSEAAPGQVISQTPAAGAKAPKGASVAIVVAAAPSATTAIVPNVTGQTQADAEKALLAAGFASMTQEASSSTVPSGNVSAQSPQGGVSAQKGTQVQLTISLGP